MDADFGFILTLSVTSCVILDNSLNVVRLQIPHL